MVMLNFVGFIIGMYSSMGLILWVIVCICFCVMLRSILNLMVFCILCLFVSS